VAADDHSVEHKVTLAQQIFGKAAAMSGRHASPPRTIDVPDAQVAAEVSQPVAASLEPVEAVTPKRERKTAAELAEMIELDLARHPDCPKSGMRVTVYGGTHWRAMLTITPAAGRVRNPQEWRDLANDLAERLSKRYALASE
jgi:hypothetical protein